MAQCRNVERETGSAQGPQRREGRREQPLTMLQAPRPNVTHPPKLFWSLKAAGQGKTKEPKMATRCSHREELMTNAQEKSIQEDKGEDTETDVTRIGETEERREHFIDTSHLQTRSRDAASKPGSKLA